jgi:DNA-binding MarR family transcriptional regulator
MGRPLSTLIDRDAEALHRAVSDLVRVYQFRDRDSICCYDISVTQCYALETVIQQGPLRLSALAERLFLDKSTTSRVVASLTRKGYVAQQPDGSDRRAIALTATKEGRRLYDRITGELVEQQRALLQELDPKVRGAVVQVIRGLAQAADARFRAGSAACATEGCCAPAVPID